MSKTLICSNVFGEFGPVSALSQPVNSAYATAHDCDYVLDTQTRASDGKSCWWEKIAFLRETLPTRDEGALVVWVDVDSLLQGGADIAQILRAGKNFGMARVYGGINGLEKLPWFNAGVIAMLNTADVRALLDEVWARRNIDQDDEQALCAALPASGVNFQELDPKWNCWSNNRALVPTPAIVTFHGIYPATAKVAAMQAFLAAQ